ncbi:MAG: MBOAT family O-acyltransferase [Pseudomonadota bacterium]
MRFDSLTFAVFLILVLGLFGLCRNWRTRKTVLIVSSYLFYAAWNPPFVILIWISTLVDYFAALKMAKAVRDSLRKFWLLVSLTSNLGMLSFFKYGDFFLQSFVEVAAQVNVEYIPPELGIILPVGISFYTFQTLSYTIDVFRKKIEPTRSITDFALFVTFFPQLVAGPIVRARDFIPQLQVPKKLTRSNLGWGGVLVTVGLFYKQVLSDALFAPIADQMFAMTMTPSFASAWAGVLAFTGQIFCDFAGYSIIAIGIALMFGFRLPDNFNAPYAALGFSDFWRRWHISLSTWLRDYLYISMGGNRRGRIATYRNLFITMLLGGLWHGAAWTFVFWGALHGFYLIIERLLRRRIPGFFASTAILNKSLIGFVTLFLVVVSWVPFRAKNFEDMLIILSAMFGQSAGHAVVSLDSLIIVTAGFFALVATQWMYRDQSKISDKISALPSGVLGVLIGFAWWMIATTPSADRAFIYFQF